MAALDGTITIKNAEYRPCIVGSKRALFHLWEQKSEIVAPSMLKGGYPGGEIKGILGIVEYEDGKVEAVSPEYIRFVDNPFAEIVFPTEGSDNG